MSVKVTGVDKKSIASGLGVKPGDILVSVNGREINDVLDYGFYTANESLSLVTQRNGKRRELELEKDADDDLGLEFESFLMDEQHGCENHCIFCFIDQLPKGLREPLYFKDDDERLSFLFGNYLTLTNLSDAEIERIIDMKISPVNVSVHTTDPRLRRAMMGNPKAGEKLKHLYRLAEAGANINCQIVLCRGINDGEKLRETLDALTALWPSVRSVACVPVGLTKYRDGLAKLKPYDEESSAAVLDIIGEFNAKCREKCGVNLVYPADEFFLMAKREIPGEEYYDDFLQIENGVGMLRTFENEFTDALAAIEPDGVPRSFELVTGVAAAPTIRRLAAMAEQRITGLRCSVNEIKNDFFGERITVAGLVTAADIYAQLKGRELRGPLLFPSDMLRRDGDMFLDSVTPQELEEKLGCELTAIDDGAALAYALAGEN